jgi:predicted RNase H-like nuclease
MGKLPGESAANPQSGEERCDMTHSGHVLGVDGCRAGWVGVVLGPDGAFARAVLGATIAELAADAGPVAAIGIDMPLRVTDEPGPRASDLAARLHLGAKRSSLFLTPPRSAYAASTYAEACAVSRRLTGKAPSRQAWALGPKILDVEAWCPSVDVPVREVHPEVSFSLLVGAPILASKATWAGLEARRAALAAAGIVVSGDLGAAGRAGPDDVLDAAAAAWSARRISRGEAECFPAGAEPGAPAIWA